MSQQGQGSLRIFLKKFIQVIESVKEKTSFFGVVFAKLVEISCGGVFL
jgi:hypothetical protein